MLSYFAFGKLFHHVHRSMMVLIKVGVVGNVAFLTTIFAITWIQTPYNIAKCSVCSRSSTGFITESYLKVLNVNTFGYITGFPLRGKSPPYMFTGVHMK